MPRIKYIEADGREYEIEVSVGKTVMQGAAENMIDGIVAECGGCCSCATCHCYVDETWLDKVSKAGEMEKEMLEVVESVRDNSRLSCQLEVTDALDGLIVHLPESQY